MAGSSRTGSGSPTSHGAGWTVQPWARAADGSAQIVLSKPFDAPDQVAGIMREVSGTAGPLRGVSVTRDHGLLSTSYDVRGTVDLAKLQTGIATDPGVVAALTNQQVDVNAVDQSLLAEIRDSFGLKVEVELPGATKTVTGIAGKRTPVDVSSSVTDTKRVALIIAAAVLLVLAVLVLVWPGRRRNRRRTTVSRATAGRPAEPLRRTRPGRRRASRAPRGARIVSSAAEWGPVAMATISAPARRAARTSLGVSPT